MNVLKQKLKKSIRKAQGFEPADLVFKNAAIVNVFTEEIIHNDIAVSEDMIIGIGHYKGLCEIDCHEKIIVPGFIDSHMHIESSMVTPLELAKAVLKSGTTTLIADPHEIVNVSGKNGLDFILKSTETIPLNVYVMLPSSAPSTAFETNGAGAFTADEMKDYLNHPRVLGLGEVMCFSDLIAGKDPILDKILLCQDKICDGHAPSLSGKALQAYAACGIKTDHECTHFSEALEKIRAGFKIMIREGSATKNLKALVTGLLASTLPYDAFLFCTDDKHLGDIHRDGHIRWNIKKAINLGMNPIKAIKMATIQAAQTYGLNHLGAIAPGYLADFVLLNDLETMDVFEVYKSGKSSNQAIKEAVPLIPKDLRLLNSVHIEALLTSESLSLKALEKNHLISIIPWQINTEHLIERIPQEKGLFKANAIYNKLCVLERHGKNGNISTAPIKGFNIKNGAIATTVAHDSHNIIVIGDNDLDMLLAIKHLTQIQGGYVVVSQEKILGDLPLPISGLISLEPGDRVEAKVSHLIDHCHNLGIPPWIDPLITLSFMALPVVPKLRLTDMGLFDEEAFEFIKI